MARQAAKLADLILIPCRPRAFDLAAVEATADLVKVSGKPAFVVFMAGPPKAALIYRDAEELIGGSDGIDLAVALQRLSDRAAFHHSTAQGQAATEFDPNGKAALEASKLWSYLLATARATRWRRHASC